MKIEIWAVGKLKNKALASNIEQYLKRLRKYQNVRIEEISIRAKSTDADFLKKAEADKILSRLTPGDHLILMDEGGQSFTSTKFAQFLQKAVMKPVNRIVFLIGGAHGFDQSVYDRSQHKISLSGMTFPHDLARLMTVEQLYRAFSILNHSPYHH
ncbi:23S rRNA (pseudouridine(1915)-N(3))-methyltransferase RlmH [Membranicola marinus]|uniref:Ribosomal RNA large subunit methyltransferase H n=1 Tax=Membranihabitans marinus TaxID=1227546 RepID=A0A953LAU3_9BACT|nr:23S rRNA (pseudouridine(1915)-N(3))-methyltransferase RlmH [Membranihabitans marinus]MBY5959038.1 23S rRNA (pseudouridine(1915)-N(3))-methyltransferase RlmH [Membranihabitans marinus]